MARRALPLKPTSRQLAAALWAATAAISINLFLNVPWWHPYCRIQADGPGYNGIGLPLPFAEPTGASSMEYFWMPHAYLLDALVLSALIYLILRRVPLPTRMASGQTAKAIAVAGLVSLLLVGGWQALIWTTGWWPRASVTTGSDHYLDFRPAFLVDPHKDGRCDY
jgi:hypothetical protein